jgi:hypothetical protein
MDCSFRYLQHLTEVARARGKEMAVRMAWASPFFRFFFNRRIFFSDIVSVGYGSVTSLPLD